MPEDSIMDMVNNIESMYGDKIAMFDRWIEQGDAWNENAAKAGAAALADHFALTLEAGEYVRGRYSKADVRKAAQEMLEEFDDYREEAIKAVVERVSRPPEPERMDPGAVEHARKYDALARQIGIDLLVELMPVSREKIQKALERGDHYLNTIPLRKWDAAGARIEPHGRNLSMAEKVSLLKHVAKWHYA